MDGNEDHKQRTRLEVKVIPGLVTDIEKIHRSPIRSQREIDPENIPGHDRGQSGEERRKIDPCIDHCISHRIMLRGIKELFILMIHSIMN